MTGDVKKLASERNLFEVASTDRGLGAGYTFVSCVLLYSPAFFSPDSIFIHIPSLEYLILLSARMRDGISGRDP